MEGGGKVKERDEEVEKKETKGGRKKQKKRGGMGGRKREANERCREVIGIFNEYNKRKEQNFVS